MKKIIISICVCALFILPQQALASGIKNLANVEGLGKFISLSFEGAPSMLNDPYKDHKGLGGSLNIGVSLFRILTAELDFRYAQFQKDNATTISSTDYSVGLGIMPKIRLGNRFIFPYIGAFAGAATVNNPDSTYIITDRKYQAKLYGAKAGLRIPAYQPKNLLSFFITSIYLDLGANYINRKYTDVYNKEISLTSINYFVGIGASF